MNWIAALSQRTDDGSTVRAHNEASARGKGTGAEEAQARLIPPPFPMPLTYVFEWWAEMHGARSEGMSGPAPLSFRDVEAWARLTGRDPEPWEIDLLFRLDRVYFNPAPIA